MNDFGEHRLAAGFRRESYVGVASTIAIETARLRLRRAIVADAGFILELLNEPGWLRFIGDRGVRTLEDAEGYIARAMLASYEQYGFGLFVTEVVPSSESIGICGLIRREGWEEVDLGFALLSRHCGQGYAREAASATLADGHGAFGFSRIVAVTNPDNLPSIRVLESIGMTCEGATRLPNGEHELLLYAHQAPA